MQAQLPQLACDRLALPLGLNHTSGRQPLHVGIDMLSGPLCSCQLLGLSVYLARLLACLLACLLCHMLRSTTCC